MNPPQAEPVFACLADLYDYMVDEGLADDHSQAAMLFEMVAEHMLVPA
ncbi:hypothetical protein [Pseudosulfitobacter pseudonitzschiae]|nr:hypothetical protein [Pseudosulfitobacter pseudonitzschiae]